MNPMDRQPGPTLLLLLFFFLFLRSGYAADPVPAVQTVSSVDLKRYMGQWYEVARYPNWFQKPCTRNVAATYSLLNDGKVEVLNRCQTATGKIKQAKGKAKMADKTTSAKLRVTFFWPFYGDYWILDLDPDYRLAVVGEPSRKYLWVLSRTPQLEETTYQQILQRLQKNGFDTSRLLKTIQVP